MSEVEVALEAGGGFRDTVHGGRALAVLTGAVLTQTDPEQHPHPVTVSALYAAAAAPGPATVVVTPLKTGRTFASFHASLQQGGIPMIDALLTAGRLPAWDTPALWDSGSEPAPDLPDLEHCVGGSQHAASRDRLTKTPSDGSLSVRLDPASAPPPYGPGGRGDFRAWVRANDETDPCLAAIVLGDGLPPVTFDLDMAKGWVPTVQMQVILRRVPPMGWLKARQWGAQMAGGLLDETCTLWAPSGELIAQARQVAAYRV